MTGIDHIWEAEALEQPDEVLQLKSEALEQPEEILQLNDQPGNTSGEALEQPEGIMQLIARLETIVDQMLSG